MTAARDMRPYLEAALGRELARVASAPAGVRNVTLNQAGFSLGQLCGSGWLDHGEVAAHLLAAAREAGLTETEARPTIRAALEAGARQPREPSEAAPAARPEPTAGDKRKSDLARSIWKAAKSPANAATARYLESRGILSLPPPTIRHAGAVKHPGTGLHLEAMVCAVQQPGGEIGGIHVTFLTPDGRKAPVSNPKIRWGRVPGGACRLARADDLVVLVEGVEDGLSIIQATGLPAWAMLGTSGFGSVELPERIRRVIVAPDSDEAGQAIIDKAGERLFREGREVHVARPPAGKDWNDLLHDFHERAGIVEFDGGQPRNAAEALARLEVFGGLGTCQ